MTVTLTPQSACVLRQLAAVHPRPVSHNRLDRRAVHRLVRDGRLVIYARMTSADANNRAIAHYSLTAHGLAVAAALPDVIPAHPFAVTPGHAEQEA